MGIGTNYGGFNYFQSDYRINNIPKAEPREAVKPVESVTEAPKQSFDIQEINNAPRTTDPNSVSLTFNKGDDFSYIGSDSDIKILDMQKAISDMKQDSILQEYNYFVGNSANVVNSEDGTVLAK